MVIHTLECVIEAGDQGIEFCRQAWDLPPSGSAGHVYSSTRLAHFVRVLSRSVIGSVQHVLGQLDVWGSHAEVGRLVGRGGEVVGRWVGEVKGLMGEIVGGYGGREWGGDDM